MEKQMTLAYDAESNVSYRILNKFSLTLQCTEMYYNHF